MMYESKLVAALKVNGKILREAKDTVYVPFGSEYQIYLKNLNSVRALVNIQIDGTDVCPNGLVLDAGREVDLERFISNGNLKSGNRFKFIERTAGVEQHRGIKAEDGIIRISFQFEVPKVYNRLTTSDRWPNTSPWPGYIKDYQFGSPSTGDAYYGAVGSTCSDTLSDTRSITKGVARSAVLNNVDVCVTTQGFAAPVNDVGITVPGSVSNQSFSTTTMGELESQEHVIVLRILGETEAGKPIQAPVTVKARPRCSTCNKLNKATAKFCSECGTSLILI